MSLLLLLRSARMLPSQGAAYLMPIETTTGNLYIHSAQYQDRAVYTMRDDPPRRVEYKPEVRQ